MKNIYTCAYISCLYLCMAWMCLHEVHAVEHSLQTLDGELQHAAEYRISAETIQFAGQTLAFADIDTIHLGNEKPINYSVLTTGVLLQDGSWLPATEITGAASEDALQVESPLGSFVIPLEFIAAWGDMRAIPQSTDVDVLVLANGNKPFGEIAGSDAQSVFMQTELSDEALPVPMTSIVAARLRAAPIDISGLYFEMRTHPLYPPLRIRPGTQPTLAIIASDASKSEQLTLTDWSHCQNMRVIGGNRVFLSDLSPASVEEKGMFGRVWKHALNRNIDGTVLVVDGQRIDHGIVMHSYSLLKWTLDKKYQHFHSGIAISDAFGKEGDCIVRVLVDGVVAWQDVRLKGGEPMKIIDLDLIGADTMSIEVNYGERYDIGDHCVFATAYLTLAQK